jgi:hypothetical protein
MARSAALDINNQAPIKNYDCIATDAIHFGWSLIMFAFATFPYSTVSTFYYLNLQEQYSEKNYRKLRKNT